MVSSKTNWLGQNHNFPENPKWVAPLTDNRPTFTLFTQVDLDEYPTCGPSLIGTLWSIRHVYIMPRTQTSTT